MTESVMTDVLDATVFERNALKNYLEAIVKNCGCDSNSIQAFSHPHCIGIMYVDHHPTGSPEDAMPRLNERLKAACKIISYCEDIIHKVNGSFANSFPALKITRFNPSLLLQALKQESTLAASEEAKGDMCAWTSLPKIIQNYWKYFNDQLRAHIMDCMMEYLQKQFGVNLGNLANSSMLFSAAGSRQFPYIPVRLPQAGIGYNKTRDLMEVLAIEERKHFSDIEPVTETNELKLKFRFSDAGTSAAGTSAAGTPVANTPTPLRR